MFAVQRMSAGRSDYNSKCVSTETEARRGKCQGHIIHRQMFLCFSGGKWTLRRHIADFSDEIDKDKD